MPQIYRLTDVEIQANRQHYSGGLVLRDQSLSHLRHLNAGKPVDTFIDNLIYREFEHKEVFYGGLLGASFGHIMAEFVHRLYYARSFQMPIVMVGMKGYADTKQQIDSTFKQVLDYLGIEENRIILVTEDIRVKTVFTVQQQSCLRGGIDNNEYINELTKYSLEYFGACKKIGKKLYVSRKNMRTGHFLGEKYLEDLLVKSGYTVFTPEKYSFVEQMRHYLESDVILFPEGSACHGIELLGMMEATSYLLPRRTRAIPYFVELLSKHFSFCKLIQNTIELPTLVHIPFNKQTPRVDAADCIVTPEIILNLEKESQIKKGLFNRDDYVLSLEKEFLEHISKVIKNRDWYFPNLSLYMEGVFKTIMNSNKSQISLNGVLDGLDTTANGWLKVTGDGINNNINPIVTVLVGDNVITTGFAIQQPKLNHEKLDSITFIFRLPLKSKVELRNFTDFKVVAHYKDTEATLRIYKPIEFALRFDTLTIEQQDQFLDKYKTNSQATGLQIQPANVLAATTRSTPPMHKLCVITYANDAGAWFPYFYQYYSRLVGQTAIYIVTPKTEAFNRYNLGGIISCSNMPYDDEARSQLISGLATGLQAYYKWTLVCDVDEIVISHPNSNLNFIEMLDSQKGDVIVSRGFDLIQMEDEADFSFDLPILKQRRFANPNIALYKPHLAKLPIQYAAGYHYCNYRLTLPEQNTGFITLHLKWACQKIRNEVAEIVAKTTYANEKMAEYSIKSVSETSFESRIQSYLETKIEHLNSSVMQAFEQKYTKNLIFSEKRGLWVGKHISAPFLVDLAKC